MHFEREPPAIYWCFCIALMFRNQCPSPPPPILGIRRTLLLETFLKPRSTFLELFIALYERGELSFGQDRVITSLGQVRDHLTLTFNAAFTIRNPI